ncbi:MAG: glycoside hydrolase family 65 protein [Deltaproteobacteria bacterium]|nr:glycoside hydrolase family 65 protein [Deltaproteobacteria bacterium]
MNEWIFRYDGYDPARQGLREALCTLGNGRFATRGAAEEAAAGEVHYPGTYLAGCYNRLETTVGGRVVVNEDLVNLPNWLCLNFRLEDGPWFDLAAVEILAYQQEIDLWNGLLTRRIRFRDPEGRTSFIRSRRFVHMRQPHLAVLRWTLLAEDWSGNVTVRSALDGAVVNAGVARYRQLNSKHLETLDQGRAGEDGVYLVVQTNQSRMRLALAARTRLFRDDEHEAVEWHIIEEPETVTQEFTVTVRRKHVVTVEKTVALYSSRDRAISECGHAARVAVSASDRFVETLEAHARTWRSLWRRCDVELPSRPEEEKILRLHAFHMLQAASPNTVGLDASVGARGLHGEAYRGHVFWDELYFLSFYIARLPEIARALLLYRYHRLDAARRAAREEGCAGAMYPWQSGSDGSEETQKLHLNPNSGRWLEDNSHRQRHVNIAIVYNVWRYYKTTGDREFLSRYGAEMILEIARFWSSLAERNETTGRYEIHGVMGPDEYHDMYPDAETGGLRNNAYTNVMVVWLLERAFEVLDLLGQSRRAELTEEIGLAPEEEQKWRDMSRRMTVPFHGEGVISQFEGYGALEEFDWDGYREKYGNIERLDRILEAEGDSPNPYKASKQADLLMLFYLLRADEVQALFRQLGYDLDDAAIRRTVDYYSARTSHGSTLSRVVHAAVSARSDPALSWRYFTEALQSDVADIQGGTTPEGIHMGAMGGLDDVLLRRYAGIETMGETLSLDPCLPDELPALRLAIVYQGRRVALDLTRERVRISLEDDSPSPLEVVVQGTKHALGSGDSEIPLTAGVQA